MAKVHATKTVRVHSSRITDYLADVLEAHEQFTLIADPFASREAVRLWLADKSYEEVDGERYYVLPAPLEILEFEMVTIRKEPTDYLKKEQS